MKSKNSYIRLLGIVSAISSLLPYCDSVGYTDVLRDYKGFQCGINFKRTKKVYNTAPIKKENIVRTYKRVH